MAAELLDVEPGELKFIFELKKQSSCSVQLTNKTGEYVAFKVKTTSPKRYCVRPNAGIIPPKSMLDFTVTLQAMRVAPADMQCKDKFLVQSTVVPFGMTEDELKPEFFSKENGRYIEDKKLRVIFVTPSYSPVLQPLNRSLKQEEVTQIPVPKEVGDSRETVPSEESISCEEVPVNISSEDVPVNFSPKEYPVSKQSDPFKERGIFGGFDWLESTKTGGVQQLNVTKSLEELKFSKDVEELKSNISILQLRLTETEKMNAALKEEKSLVLTEKEKLKQELAMMKHKHVASVRVGFPFLFVCFIGLVGIAIGYMLRGE